MTINYKLARKHLEAFDFKKLFIEVLGWGHGIGSPTSRTIDGAGYRLTPVAELGGMVVLQCEPQAGEGQPPMPARRKIERTVSQTAFEHILIFTDRAHTRATWQWVKRGVGASRQREHTYTRGQPGDSLLQKLAGIAFKLDELDDDGRVAIGVVTGKVTKAFDLEKVTKKFYEDFKGEHADFLKFIRGIPDDDDRAWYASVMLNRLMFIYFIQKKGFLDGDPDYLQHKLAASQARGADRFYRDFLVPLFFEGFAQEPDRRSAETRRLLGNIPYLNGGLFVPHDLECKYDKAIAIPDAIFARRFAFFDKYTWHLDDRPWRADNEINPDVLGYIFEKYINQKQMGAYYTKEDITGYICRNTILPFLLDKLGDRRYAAVHPLPLADVEPYIYPAVKQAETLPTETAREYAARQGRLAGIRADFAAGKIAAINDLITYNLDIEAFVQDWLAELADPLALRAFYFECLKKLTVLDLTVGSGAFLFAAMNILEPLYEICLDRMAELADPKYPDFTAELTRVAQHPNRAYFIYKSIIVHNLYGVDIMEEAVEICKLRLFLKLVAQVDDVAKIEPLPDIDFNIRAGNTLVGYATQEEVAAAGSRSLFNLDLEARIAETTRGLDAFRAMQDWLGVSPAALAQAKADVREKLRDLEGVLDEALANEYRMEVQPFIASHQPFHWYVQFHGIMREGGFDVIVGNPPYVEYSKVRAEYRIKGYQTESAGNLYAFCIERCYGLLLENGRLGFVIQQPFVSTQRMEIARRIVLNSSRSIWASTYDDRPSKLFDGMHHARIAILMLENAQEKTPNLFVTRYNKWYAEERAFLFQNLTYIDTAEHEALRCYPKMGSTLEQQLAKRVLEQKGRFEQWLSVKESSYSAYYKITGVGHWFTITARPPKFFRDGAESSSTREQAMFFPSKEWRDLALCLLNSSLFYWFYQVRTNCRDFNPSDYKTMPVPVSLEMQDMTELSTRLQQALDSSSTFINVTHSLSGNIQMEQFRPRECKPIIDEIDRVLARHYGFTAEELDFIINYDIKYRLGKDAATDEDEDRIPQ